MLFGHQAKCDARARRQPGHGRNAKTISTPPTIPGPKSNPNVGRADVRWRQSIAVGACGANVAIVIRRKPNEHLHSKSRFARCGYINLTARSSGIDRRGWPLFGQDG